jgi:hypothetical protein
LLVVTPASFGHIEGCSREPHEWWTECCQDCESKAGDSNNQGYIMWERTLLPADQILILAASGKSVPKLLKTCSEYTMWETQTN